MPFIGIGLHVLIALYFGVHAIRSGQNLYWLIILFSFPLLGSVVYLFAVYLPDSRLEHGARKVVKSAAKALDPTRELREAQAVFDYTPTAQNQMRLAAALLDADRPEQAAVNYEACLHGPFADDLHIRFGAAQAYFACGRHADAVAQLIVIQQQDADFRGEAVVLLMARAHAAAGQVAEARQCFETALTRFGGIDAKIEYLIWAVQAKDQEIIARLKAEVETTIKRWNRHARTLNRTLLKRLDAAYAESR